MIINRDRIPPLPRGMLATRYDDIPADERRVLARMGARDPIGVRLAMKRHKAESIDDLVSKLEHYEAERRTKERINNAIGRLVGGTPYPPHQKEILRDERERAKAKKGDQKEIEMRVRITRKAFKEIN
jgi:hypothetical protein